MYRNKHGFFKRALFRLYDRAPATANIKGLFLPFRARSFAKRLESRRQAVQTARQTTGRSPLFNHVEIETHNRCNGECGFCPVNRHVDPRPAARMTDEMFHSIIAQLKELHYQGEVCLYSNNESLIDTRIEAFTAHARRELPEARFLLSTNGTLLTLERYKNLIDNVDLLYINNYCDDFRLTPANAELIEAIHPNPEWWAKTHFAVRYRREIMSSRGGQAPNKRSLKRRTLSVGCVYPATQLIIRPDGKLSLCCNDAIGKMTLGDLTKQSIAEAWYSPEYEALRSQVLASRGGVPLCRYCDTLAD